MIWDIFLWFVIYSAVMITIGMIATVAAPMLIGEEKHQELIMHRAADLSHYKALEQAINGESGATALMADCYKMWRVEWRYMNHWFLRLMLTLQIPNYLFQILFVAPLMSFVFALIRWFNRKGEIQEYLNEKTPE